MGRADTHLAACAIAAALLLAGANGAVAAADPVDSAAAENPSSTASDSGPDQSAHTSASSTGASSENAGTVGDQAGQAAQDNSGDAKESPKESGDEQVGKKPADDDSGTSDCPGKTVTRAPLVLPEAPPPIDLPPALPATPADPDIVDAAAGGEVHHPDRNEPPVLTVPIVVAPPPTPPMHILGVSVAPRVGPSEPAVKWMPQWGGEPAPRLLRASTSERLLREPPANVGLTARGQNPDRTGYNNEQVRRPLADMAAGALPGVAGIVMMTATGICLGYRQAKIGQLLRIEGADPFLG